jgi:glycosyltransferase involved in cell wall biosynthesis
VGELWVTGGAALGGALKIVFVITELEVGGAERCLVNLATRIDRARFEPIAVSLAPRPAPGEDSLVVQLEQAEVPVHFLDRHSVWQFPAATRQLTGLLKELRPDLVQTFLFHANVAAATAARRAAVRRVLAGIRVADPRRWRSWIERWACRNVDRFVCVSEAVARHCRSHGYPEAKLAVIANGVDAAEFAQATPIDLVDLGVPAGRRALVFIGRLDRQKGLDDLLAACPQLFEQLSGHDLLIVGDGPLRAVLMQQAARLGVSSRVHFTGWRADVPAILAAADLLVLPSHWEGMPNVVLEAMAAGKPVVATRVEGVEEALGASARDQCVAVGSQEELVQRIVHFAQAVHLARDVGQANQQRAKCDFSLEAMVTRYEELYESLRPL